ncbi:putative AraC family transcriptional regulator [Gordonia araii NBRC 100433]|uniref:Putative AraC family transcriptional regulator n=1 Tax=Gordonia araii NBRC 100433 TaxID=1073574 RepID=G7GX44_9ACTN|nr:helix-turn-helix transcriptional regulator [Gordonia araii]NNG98200.1 helix-turn-helix transcriptional regulator [Gordonia araii NBRC 100433]GAB08169.1 putative AraC family transcriptional regulator [Gordonia araii NBRC 100433]
MELRDVRGLTGIEVNPYRIVGAEPGEHIGLPSSTVTLIVDLASGLNLSEPEQARVRTFRCCLGGMHLRPVTIHHDGTQIGIALGLDPAAARTLFGVPAGELWSTNIELDAAAPGLARRLYDETGAVPHEQRAAVAKRIVAEVARSSSSPPANPDAEHAWRVIQQTRGAITVAELVERSGWSARRLTGVFTAEYGAGPKQAARLARFDHARERLEAGEAIAAVAFACGYSDQSHLTREFTAIAGHPPREFLAVRAAEFSGAAQAS